MANLEERKFCTNCGAMIGTGGNFCEKCGAPISNNGTQNMSDQPNSQSSPLPPVINATPKPESQQIPQPVRTRQNKEQKWETTSDRIGRKLVTTIHAVDNILDIEQYNKFIFIFKFGAQKARIDINKISEIATRKKISLSSVFLALLGAVIICSGRVLVGGAALVLGLCALKTEYLCITHKSGFVKIQDEFVSNERERFFDYIRAYNPDCIKIIIDN